MVRSALLARVSNHEDAALILRDAAKAPLLRMRSFVIDPLSLTRIDRLENGWRVLAVNRRA